MKAALQVIAHLERAEVACALIGGVALGVHGVARATLDTDLLVDDPVVLRPSFWRGYTGGGGPDIRRGDADDPLAGVVRFGGDTESVDVILVRGAWIREILGRRIHVRVQRRRLPLVDRADLVLLKLFAAGPQDLLDARLLLASDRGRTRALVVSRLPDTPRAVRQAFSRLVGAP